MKKPLVRGLVLAALLATGLATQTVRASALAELAGICYEFPGGLTVCCDAGGCYIK
jgi:hypothetical protein